MYFSHVINSPTCFGTPQAPSSGSLRSCYHTLSRYDNNYEMHVKLVLQTKLAIIRGKVRTLLKQTTKLPRYGPS
jgi:hypothetical protein